MKGRLFLLLLFLVALLATFGCANNYVQRINSDCRILRDFTVVDTDACVVCAKKGKAVMACSLSSDER